MAEVIIFFIYIALICLCTGAGIWKLLKRFTDMPDPDITRYIVTGIVTLTVLTGWASIFMRISALFHLIVLVIAGLCAEGETEVTGLDYIDRGYDDFVGKFRSLGAEIARITE